MWPIFCPLFPAAHMVFFCYRRKKKKAIQVLAFFMKRKRAQFSKVFCITLLLKYNTTVQDKGNMLRCQLAAVEPPLALLQRQKTKQMPPVQGLDQLIKALTSITSYEEACARCLKFPYNVVFSDESVNIGTKFQAFMGLKLVMHFDLSLPKEL